jgi:hypothetical protein
MGQHPSKVMTTPFPNFQANMGQQQGQVRHVNYMVEPIPYSEDPRIYQADHPFPPAPLFVNNDFVQLPPQSMDYPDEPRRGGYRRPPRGQRVPPPRRGDCNPPARRGRRRDDMDEMSFFRDDDDYDDDDDFLNLDFSDLKSTRQDRQGGFDPFVENPRLYTREQLENGGARELMDNVRQRARQRVEPARRQNDQARPMPQRGHSRRPAGRQPPQNQNNEPQSQAPGPGYKFVPVQPGGAPQTIVIGYDHATGAIHQPGGNQGPSVLGYSQQEMPPYQIISPASCYPQPCTAIPQSYLIPSYM